jgi:hypothetical protein
VWYYTDKVLFVGFSFINKQKRKGESTFIFLLNIAVNEMCLKVLFKKKVTKGMQ